MTVGAGVTGPVEHYRAFWPVTDESLTFDELRAQGESDLPRLLHFARVAQVGRGRWCLRPGSDVPGSGGAHTVLIADVPVVRVPRNVDTLTGQRDALEVSVA